MNIAVSSFFSLYYDTIHRLQTDASWKARFTSTAMNDVHEQAYGAKNPTYATILQLDRKMRSYPVPTNLQIAGFGGGATGSNAPGGVSDLNASTIMILIAFVLVRGDEPDDASTAYRTGNQRNE
jgi:hypothetical protein